MIRAVVVFVVAQAGVASADVLYSQPNDRPSEASFFSDAVEGQFFNQRVADNFTLGADSTVDAVRFWGGSQNFQFASPANMASWTVRIFGADGSGGVDLGNEVFAQTYLNGGDPAMTMSATGDLNLGGGQVFEHFAQTGGVSLAAGDYWVSVGATLVNPGADAWVWAGSTVGDLVNATDFYDANGFIVFDPTFNDLAFEIEGTVVPAPASAAAIGFAGLVGLRRRR